MARLTRTARGRLGSRLEGTIDLKQLAENNRAYSQQIRQERAEREAKSAAVAQERAEREEKLAHLCRCCKEVKMGQTMYRTMDRNKGGWYGRHICTDCRENLDWEGEGWTIEAV